VLERVFGQASKCTGGNFDCYSAHTLAKEVFLDSDTDVAVVSALWGIPNPTPIDYAAESREIIAAIGGEGARALIHGGVFPNEPGEIEAMDEKAQVPRLEYDYSSPRDMGPAARANPDLTFLVYHGGFEGGVAEGPYNPDDPKGVDRLIKSHQDAGFRPNEGNLYAEMGSLWRYFMSRPDEAAHVMGKLLKYFGEERIMWGTDSIWYGSPQWQIEALRRFQIPERLIATHGYAQLTPAIKSQIFGLNAARLFQVDVTAKRNPVPKDYLQRLKLAYREEGAQPSHRFYGWVTG
jgi:hypothetical protein